MLHRQKFAQNLVNQYISHLYRLSFISITPARNHRCMKRRKLLQQEFYPIAFCIGDFIYISLVTAMESGVFWQKDSKIVRRKESRFRSHLNLRHILLPCLEKFRLSSLTINSTFIHKLQNLIRFNLCCLCLHSLVDSKTVATALFLGVDIYHFS